MISIDKIKKLRVATNISIMECRKALEEAEDDFEGALKILKKKGAEMVEKKKARETKEGLIGVYLHRNGKISAMVKVLVETDFVAKNENFQQLCHNLAMQVVAMNPKDLKELLLQPYIKDTKKQVKDLIEETISKVGENIRIEEFIRMEI